MNPPEKNHLDHLDLILEALAKHQVGFLTSQKETLDVKWELESALQPATNFDAKEQNQLESLAKEINKLHEDGVVVPSLGGVEKDTVFIDTAGQKAVFVGVESGMLVSPVYDALWYIFTLTNEKIRQENFEELVKHYFEYLRQFLNQANSDFKAKFTEDYTDYLVRLFLPVIKITIKNIRPDQAPQELQDNISNYFKSPLINQEDIYVILRNRLESDSYKLVEFNMRPLSDVNGHLGQYYHLDIKFRLDGKDQEVTLFAKFIIPPTETMGALVKSGLSKREHFFYNSLIPLFKQDGLDELLDFAPKCYLSRVGWLIVLDDLSQVGYVGLKPNNVLDYAALRYVVSALARFHVCSIIYEEIISKSDGKQYILYDEFPDYLNDVLFMYDDSSPLKIIYDASKEGIKYMLNLFPDLTKDLPISEDEIRHCIDDIYMSNFAKLKTGGDYRNVVCHGDTYLGNLLLKYDENQTVSDALLVDFQTLRYCPPATDLLFVLHSATTKETRKLHLRQLTEEYYHHLERHLKHFDLDPEKVYPRVKFEESLKSMKSFSIITALEYNHIIHIDPKLREELFHDQEKFDYYLHQNRKELIDISWSSEHYRTIVRGLLEDVVDLIRNKDF